MHIERLVKFQYWAHAKLVQHTCNLRHTVYLLLKTLHRNTWQKFQDVERETMNGIRILELTFTYGIPTFVFFIATTPRLTLRCRKQTGWNTVERAASVFISLRVFLGPCWAVFDPQNPCTLDARTWSYPGTQHI